ncbi:hypothetical protein [Rhizobium sp. L43]|uniref:hypothetical protein n=1 Tax=Rhizobium sp. L43 TaxID=2035452 RepID=UPI000BE7D2D1|nr:hypothetical protein [Rhizobium sp. L43]PDS79169.1 hypothetical protein CO667_10150 [Rhizobium sp. L43]
MTAPHDPLREAINISLEVQAILTILSGQLERLAESGAQDPDELHRLSRITDASSRLLSDIVSEIEDALPEFDALRLADERKPPK